MEEVLEPTFDRSKKVAMYSTLYKLQSIWKVSYT